MFKERTTKPDPTNKYYISSRYDGKKGWNPCILGNNKIVGRDPYLNVLPNCVGWSVGRFNENVGKENCDFLYIIGGNNNAKHLYDNAISQGLEVGAEPREGAVVVWSSSGCGHVANVERVECDKIRVSQSGWDTTAKNRMWFADHYKGNGDWIEGTDYYWMKGKYKLKGFIYLPKEGDDLTEKEVQKIALDTIKGYLEGLKALPPSPYAEDALAKALKDGVMKGDEHGNQMPKAYITRQDVVVMLDRCGLL